MKTKEILEKHLPKRYYGHEARKNAERAMSEIGQQTRDEMFEFTKWTGSNEMFYDPKVKEWIFEIDIIDGYVKYKTTKEVFEYWQLNIKEK